MLKKIYIVVPGLFFLNQQGISGRVFLQTRETVHALGERRPTVCTKTIPLIRAIPRNIVYMLLLLIIGLSACSGPTELRSPCPNYGAKCAQTPLNY